MTEVDAPPDDPWGYAELLLWAVLRNADAPEVDAAIWRASFPELSGIRDVEEMAVERGVYADDHAVGYTEIEGHDDTRDRRRRRRHRAWYAVQDAVSKIRDGRIRCWERGALGESMRLKSNGEFPEIERWRSEPNDNDWQRWRFSRREVVEKMPCGVRDRFASFAAFARDPGELSRHIGEIEMAGDKVTLGNLSAAIGATWGDVAAVAARKEWKRYWPERGKDRLRAVKEHAAIVGQGAK